VAANMHLISAKYSINYHAKMSYSANSFVIFICHLAYYQEYKYLGSDLSVSDVIHISQISLCFWIENINSKF
jgi:hypothetical protein